MKLNLASGLRTITSDGWRNHDPDLDGWRFQDGLPYDDGTVEGISVSHGLCYLPIGDWPAVFAEFARVLEPGGVVRVQDEWADNPASAYYPVGFPGVGGIGPACVTLTTPEMVVAHMDAAGLDAAQVGYDATTFHDHSLIQSLHSGEPNSFAVEGRKP